MVPLICLPKFKFSDGGTVSTHSETVETDKDGAVHHYHKHTHEHTIEVKLDNFDTKPQAPKPQSYQRQGTITDGDRRIKFFEHVSMIGPGSEWFHLKNL